LIGPGITPPDAMDPMYFSHVTSVLIEQCTIVSKPNYRIIGRLEEGKQAIVLDLIIEPADSRRRFQCTALIVTPQRRFLPGAERCGWKVNSIFNLGAPKLQQVGIYTNSPIAQPSFQHPYHAGVHSLLRSALPSDQHHHLPAQLPC
jgi:hypothetical protein